MNQKQSNRFGVYKTLLLVFTILCSLFFDSGCHKLQKFVHPYEAEATINGNQPTKQQEELNEETKSVLLGLSKDIYVYTTFPISDKTTADPSATNPTDQSSISTDDIEVGIIKLMKSVSSHIIYENHDIRQDPLFLDEFKVNGNISVQPGDIIISDKDKKLYWVLDPYDQYDYSVDQDSGVVTKQECKAEKSLSKAIYYINQGSFPTAYLLQGHKEPALNELDDIATCLHHQYCIFESLNISDNPGKFKAGDVCIILNPTADILASEYKLLESFAGSSGRFFVMLDPVSVSKSNMPNFGALLKLFGIELKSGIILEGDSKFTIDNKPTYIVPAVKDIRFLPSENMTLIAPLCGAIRFNAPSDNSFAITPLLSTSDKAFLKDVNSLQTEEDMTKTAGDEAGPFNIAVAIEKQSIHNNVKCIVVYNSLFITNRNLLTNTNNIDFFNNCTQWLLE